MSLRVSIDHYTPAKHEAIRGEGTWKPMIEGLKWLGVNGFALAVAGRSCWEEGGPETRAGYARLFAAEGICVDADDPAVLVLFPEMDETADVPEITVSCWDILGVAPDTMMCASSRMVIKRRGAAAPVVVPCTLLPYDRRFERGESRGESLGTVKLNHPYCAMFCVLGGGSCSAASG